MAEETFHYPIMKNAFHHLDARKKCIKRRAIIFFECLLFRLRFSFTSTALQMHFKVLRLFFLLWIVAATYNYTQIDRLCENENGI